MVYVRQRQIGYLIVILNRLPWKVVDNYSLEVLEARWDRALSNLV